MERKTRKNDFLSIAVIILLGICSLTGILSTNFTKSFDVINQYGDTVTIFGSGIYAGDTYFKAPIQIGSDLCILLVLIPLFILSYKRIGRESTNRNIINMLSLYVVAFYYASSIAFGVKYNQLHLIYIALFGCTFFGILILIRKVELENISYPLTKGLRAFLVISSIALIVAWLPDIIPTIFNGRPIKLIGVYTTEITYVIDMGIIAPLCLVCLLALQKKDSLGTVILAAILKLCLIIGIMMIPQSVFQYLSGVNIPLPVLITKTASFVILGGFAFYFERRLYEKL